MNDHGEEKYLYSGPQSLGISTVAFCRLGNHLGDGQLIVVNVMVIALLAIAT